MNRRQVGELSRAGLEKPGRNDRHDPISRRVAPGRGKGSRQTQELFALRGCSPQPGANHQLIEAISVRESGMSFHLYKSDESGWQPGGSIALGPVRENLLSVTEAAVQ